MSRELAQPCADQSVVVRPQLRGPCWTATRTVAVERTCTECDCQAKQQFQGPSEVESVMSHKTKPTSMTDVVIRWANRAIPMSRSTHVCGQLSWTPSPQRVAVESRLEAHIANLLIHSSGLLALHSQPFTMACADGPRRVRYTPDFLAVFDRPPRFLVRLGFGSWTVIEVKSHSMLDPVRERLEQRFQTIRRNFGFSAVVLTERDLPSLGTTS